MEGKKKSLTDQLCQLLPLRGHPDSRILLCGRNWKLSAAEPQIESARLSSV